MAPLFCITEMLSEAETGSSAQCLCCARGVSKAKGLGFCAAQSGVAFPWEFQMQAPGAEDQSIITQWLGHSSWRSVTSDQTSGLNQKEQWFFLPWLLSVFISHQVIGWFWKENQKITFLIDKKFYIQSEKSVLSTLKNINNFLKL